MNIELLAQLAKAVEAAPDEMIDMEFWKYRSCFCALGLAASLGIGGLRLEASPTHETFSVVVTTDGGDEGFNAASEVFGLNDDTAEWLFSPRNDKERQQPDTDRQIWLSRYHALLGHGV